MTSRLGTEDKGRVWGWIKDVLVDGSTRCSRPEREGCLYLADMLIGRKAALLEKAA